MKDADKNRCPARARKRATSDLRCAAKKLGLGEAINALREMQELRPTDSYYRAEVLNLLIAFTNELRKEGK